MLKLLRQQRSRFVVCAVNVCLFLTRSLTSVIALFQSQKTDTADPSASEDTTAGEDISAAEDTSAGEDVKVRMANLSGYILFVNSCELLLYPIWV